MRKAILLSMCMCLFFFSCKKEHSNKPNTVPKTYSVKFNVSGFTQTIVNSTQQKQANSLKTADVSIPANYIKMLYYMVYDTAGNIVHRLIQDSTNTNLGQIADNLPAGKYTVAIGAGKTGFTTQNSYSGTDHYKYLNFGYGYYYTPPFPGWQDAFVKAFSITVAGGDINQTVNLDRRVGQLEVDIQDAIPPTASALSITVNPESQTYLVSTGAPYLNIGSYTSTTAIPTVSLGTTDYTTDEVIGNTASPITVTITCYDAAKNILGIATIENVTCQQNTRTILKGDLFGSNNAFNVTLNLGWASPVLIPFNVKNQIK